VTDDRFDALYEKYGPVIFVRCRKLLGDHAAAEDATQETFLRIHRQIDRVPGEREALLWIYRVATNHCLDLLRHRALAKDAGRLMETRGSEPLENLLADQELVRKLVARASPNEAAAATLHYLNGLNQGEAAEVLGVSRRTVVAWLSAFLEKARQWVGEEESA
jgi:RNA polymerase sigma-70 factor, ECF subfamily